MNSDTQSVRQKILIVDDRQENLVALRRVLADLDTELVEANNGNDALAATLHHNFALAILDIMMPGMDGYELANLLRGDLRTHRLPIIFLTAAAGEDAQVFMGYESGGVDYIVKPYNPMILLAKVQVFLELDRKTLELEEKIQALAASEDRYRSLVMTVPDVIYRIDRGGRFTFLNDAINNLGYSPSQLIGRHFSEIMHPDYVTEASREMALAKLAGQATEPRDTPRLFDERRSGDRKTSGLEINLILGQGNVNPGVANPLNDGYVCAEVNSSGIYSTNHDQQKPEFLGTVGIIRDISERKALMDALAEAKEEAETATQAKSAFLANMSHEIRSPMNAMLGLVYLLEQKALDKETRELVRKVSDAGQTLLAIINDILDFSKIESGNLEIEHLPFRLSDVLDRVATLMSASAGDKKIELIINPCPLFANNLVGDPLRLQQVLVNLTSNAIKFTEKGEVELSIKVVEAIKGDSVKLHFAVYDTGIGISSEKQDDIFTAFTQANSTISRRFGGSGLGLSICRQLVNLMGGALRVDSEEGKGSTFWFELTFGLDQNPGQTLSSLQRLELLIVEDSDSVRTALVNIANSLGCMADVVESGEAAYIRTLEYSDSPKSYDLVILDWQISGLDGLTTAKIITESFRSGKNKKNKPPIIMMVSAYLRDELLAQPNIDCVDFILNKPVTPSSFYDAILAVLKKPASISPMVIGASTEDKQQRLAGVRILVVDDSDINREIAKNILTLHGASVSLAEDGEDAINWLNANLSAVDVILMDVQMPRMDGYETTSRIRQDTRLAKLPIVALTAGAYTADQDNARESGMDDFVAKPFNVEQLISVVQRLARNAPDYHIKG